MRGMTSGEFSEFLDSTGIRPVEVALRFGMDPSKVSRMKTGLDPITPEFTEQLVEWAAAITQNQAQYAKAQEQRFVQKVAA